MLSAKTALEMLKTGSTSSTRWLKPLKMLKTRTALGVDISDKQVSLALLKRGKNGTELLTSATTAVPDGVIKDGNIENVAVLADVIKKLKNSRKIRTTRAAVSLFIKPVIVQIMGIPKQVPSNIGQFVQDQVKHFAVLPSNKIALDFCGVGGASLEANIAGRLLVVAADDRKVTDIVNVCRQAGLTLEAIEPPLLAYTRALYDKKIAGKFDRNVLIAILQDNTLNICVFSKQTMDFVRTKSISEEKTPPNDICQWIAEQINTVIQFYDVETPNSSGKWEITVSADCAQLPRNAEETLRINVASANLQLLTSEDICQDAVVSQSRELINRQPNDKPSPVAIGLAMKLLDKNTQNLGANLLPTEVAQIRTARREALITANIIAMVLLIMVLAINGPNWKIKKINERISLKRAQLLRDTQSLVREKTSVKKQINTVNNELNQINEILNSYRDTDWPGLLNDIAKRIPKIASITSLSGVTNSSISLKGMAMSNEAVYVFADTLNNSEHINSASIAETKRDNRGLIIYEINCSLAPGKGKQ